MMQKVLAQMEDLQKESKEQQATIRKNCNAFFSKASSKIKKPAGNSRIPSDS
ncbi:hypothetical protein ACHAQH_008853 [Verticillium albo-atrum]